jgi:hypothetical protein
MRTAEPDRSLADGLLAPIVTAAEAARVVLGLTALGVLVRVAELLLTAVSSLLPELDAGRPRHDADRVRERLKAARDTAEASGVLWPKVPDRTGRHC